MAKTFDVSILFKVMDRATGALRTIGTQFGALSSKIGQLGVRARQVGKDMAHLGRSMAMRVTAPIIVFAALALKSAANIESMSVSFEVMLGSGERAAAMVKDLVDFAARTPFQLGGIGTATKQLLGFGVQQKDIVGILGMLGDVAAGVNMPLEDMSAIYGKIRAKGKLMAEQLNQMSERSIPVVQMLADAFGTTQAAIYEAAAEGKISFDIVNEVLRRMTIRGGIYFEMMGKQSRTLAGLFSTLKDAVTMALAEIGQVIVDTFDVKESMKKFTTWIEKATKWFTSFAKTHPLLTKVVLILVGIAAAAAPVLIVLGAIAAGIAALANPIVWVVAAIALMVAQSMVMWYLFLSNWGKIRNFFVGVWRTIVDTFDAAYNWIVGKINAILGLPGLKTMLKLMSYATPAGLAVHAAEAIVGIEKKRESKITVELKAAPGTEATLKKAEGDDKVNVISETALGGYVYGMY